MKHRGEGRSLQASLPSLRSFKSISERSSPASRGPELQYLAADGRSAGSRRSLPPEAVVDQSLRKSEDGAVHPPLRRLSAVAAALAQAIWLFRIARGTTHCRRGIVLFLLVTIQAGLGIATLLTGSICMPHSRTRSARSWSWALRLPTGEALSGSIRGRLQAA